MSQLFPWGRLTPRASAVGQPVGAPASIDGLLAYSARVDTEPPLFARVANPAVPLMSPKPRSLHELSELMLWPDDEIKPDFFTAAHAPVGDMFAPRIVLRIVMTPFPAYIAPPAR